LSTHLTFFIKDLRVIKEPAREAEVEVCEWSSRKPVTLLQIPELGFRVS